jgi:hypothetical protein
METRIVPLHEARQELAACKVVYRLPRYRDLFAPAEAAGEVDGFLLLRSPVLTGQPDYEQLLRAVEALQRAGLVHRRIFTARGLLGDFSAAFEVKTAFARARELFYDAREGPVDLRLLGAAAQHPLTRPVLIEVCGSAAALYEKYLGQPREAVLRGLLAGWRTWDLYAVELLFPGRSPRSLDADPAKRPSVASLLPPRRAAAAAAATPHEAGGVVDPCRVGAELRL